MRENWPVARWMQPGLGWMSTVGLSSKMLPKDELSWRSLPPPSIISLKPYFLCILPDYRFFFWLYNDLQICAVFFLTKRHYWSRRPGKSFLPVQNPCPCCRPWGIHPSPDLHPEGPCVHCQSGKSHTVHSICWDALCCHTRRWYCYSTASASAACPDWWWMKEIQKNYCSMGVFTFNKLYSWMHSACFPCQKKKR